MKESSASQVGTVYFIGAGPGAPDLITVRGRTIIDQADCIIYAGSLVNPALFDGCTAPLYNSAAMHLEEIVALMVEVCAAGGTVARVHTGDPSLYGAIQEQMELLDRAGVAYETVPGVTSAFGAAASLKTELTVPEVTQSVIITRRAGRTPVPDSEALPRLASHRATMIIFLSAAMIQEVAAELIEGGYPADTPVSVVMKATWPDERILSGTLDTIAGTVREAGITRTALICVGAVFGDRSGETRSRLYDKTFTHGMRGRSGGNGGSAPG